MSYRRLLENGSGRLLESGSYRLIESGGIVALFLPNDFAATLITAGNADPFGIDPDRTMHLSPDADVFSVAPGLTTLITAGNADPFGIDPDRTTPISVY